MKRKVDNRIRVLVENGATLGHRSLLVVVGDKARDQVVYLHHMLSKTSLKQASVLWCYKKELALSSHRKKRMKQIKARIQSGQLNPNEDDPFEMFVSMTEIRYCYYKETHKILGNTFKMCVLQVRYYYPFIIFIFV
ncbi:N-acetyltransferase 10 [Halocaridina rubra]|uniref:N-acetyltransferase 10 n=1 Tax=Halocaridina rubra TaxID=373956 RepID=A0AAN9FV72_HALRR